MVLSIDVDGTSKVRNPEARVKAIPKSWATTRPSGTNRISHNFEVGFVAGSPRATSALKGAYKKIAIQQQ
jgi:hypothetical protein